MASTDFNQEYASASDAHNGVNASGLPPYMISMLNTALAEVGPLPEGKHYKVIASVQAGKIISGSVAIS